MKYIDAKKLKKAIEDKGLDCSFAVKMERLDTLALIDELQQEKPDLPGIEKPGIPGKDYIPVEWVDACEKYGKWKIVKHEQPEVDIEKEIEEHAIYMPHGEFVSDNEILEDMEWAREEFRHFYELGLKARKEV